MGNFTNQELKDKMSEVEEKYDKLRKVAYKLGKEMESLVIEYTSYRQELEARGIII